MADTQSSRYGADDANVFANGRGTAEQRLARLREIQSEALGSTRRDHISTDEIIDPTRVRLSLRDMERQRRVNQQGTQESAISEDVKEKLNHWNSAWKRMENDALLEEGLEDIHAGQTHRDRLLRLAPSVQQAALVTRDGLEERLEEGRRFSSDVQARTYSRGGSRGGRGWGVAGRNQVRHAQRRVPTAGTPNAQQQLLSNPMSRVLLPSITGRPAASESQGGFAGRVRAQVNTSASTTNRGRPPRANVENFRLVQPSQFLSHVRPVINTTAPRASVSSQNQSTPTVQPASISNPQGVPGANIQAVAEPEMATLLDEDVDRADEPREPGPRKSYAEDLLDMSIEEPSDLPPPMELSSKIEEGSVHPAVLEADEHEMASQLESFMPVLQSLLSPEIIGHINSELRRMNIAPGQPSQRTDPAADTTQEKHAKAQQSAIQNEYRPLQSRKQESRVPPPSLANLVEKRTQEWSQQVIASTLTYKGPIFGEHLVRSRWSERHNSSASVASSTGLVEGIRKLRLDETQAPVAPPPVDSAKSQPLNTTQYATANPFGPKPTTGGQDQPGSTRTRQTSIFGSAAPPRESQLPDYVRSSYQPGDHGAAVRAQYLGIASTRMSGHGNSVTTSTRNPQSPQATHGSREADTTSSQGASSMHLNAIGSTLNDGQHLPGTLRAHDHQPLSQGLSTISPGLGEDMIRPQRCSGIPAFNQPISTPYSQHYPAPTRPRPASFLGTSQPARDPGAAARAQYGGQTSTHQSFSQPQPTSYATQSNYSAVFTSEASRVLNRPRPASFLTEAQPARDLDPGAAARQQYGQTERNALREPAAPTNNIEPTPPLSEASARATAPQKLKGKITDYYTSSGSKRADSSKNVTSTGEPPKPATGLAGSSKGGVTDPGAMARKQYGMKENAQP